MKRLFFVPKPLYLIGFFLFVISCLPLVAQAQETDDLPLPKDAAPPPLTMLSKDEKQQLELENNIKKRTKLCMELMESRLKTAEGLVEQNKFQETINELGGFQALLENALNFLERKDTGGSKTDYNYKRLEIGLRQTVSRLELVRREMPFKYGYYVVKLQKFVREARAKAIEPLFDDTVIPTNNLQSKNKIQN